MSTIVYSDKLVEITEDSILFRNYYFPFGSKTVNLTDVKSVKALEPTLWNGKWRIYGTGDFHTWFPLDKKRPDRDLIFLMTLKKRWWRVGFTVENSSVVSELLRAQGFMNESG
jgi:hypothetical protein